MAKWQCSTSRDLAVASAASEWDADAASARIFSWAGWPDDPHPDQARRGFLAYDSEHPDKRSSYKLPIADVIDGELVVIDAAVRSAVGRLPRTHTLPEPIQGQAMAVLIHYDERLAQANGRSELAVTGSATPDAGALLEAHAAATRTNDPIWRAAGQRGMTVVSQPWDGTAARERVFAWAGWPENPDPARARRAFLVYDEANPDLKGSYQLPIADVVGTKLRVIAEAVRQAAQAIGRATIPDDVRAKAQGTLDSYLAALDEAEPTQDQQEPAPQARQRQSGTPASSPQAKPTESPGGDRLVQALSQHLSLAGSTPHTNREVVIPTPDSLGAERSHTDLNISQLTQIMRRSDPLDALGAVFPHPAQVHARATSAELTQLALTKYAMDPDIFQERPPFFWDAEISSNRLDAYFTRMHPTTLRNFARDAEAGVSFQNSHDTRTLGFGRSLTGTYIGPQGNGVSRVQASFYTIPGVRLNQVSTDDLIYGMRAGIIKDTSVGFFGGRFICSICGRDMLRDYECYHIPGVEYVPESEGSAGVMQVAEASVEDAHLAEVSAVYDGATPGAAILKAVREADAGRIKPTTVRLLEARYRMALPTARRMVAGAGLPGSPASAPEFETRPEPTDHDQEDQDMAVRDRSTQPAAGTGGAPLTPEPQTAQPTPPPVTPPAAETASTAADDEVDVDEILEPVRTALLVAGAPEGQTEVAGIRWLVQERERLAAERERLMPFQSEVAVLQRDVADRDAELARLRPLAAEVEQARVQRAELERLRPLAEEVLRLRPLQAEVEELRPLRERVRELEQGAKDGQTYRNDLINEAMAQGVRAFGPSFAKETYQTLLTDAPLDVIKRMRDDWKYTADKQFSGGRRTVDQAEEPPEGGEEAIREGEPVPPPSPQPATRTRMPAIPDAAYAG